MKNKIPNDDRLWSLARVAEFFDKSKNTTYTIVAQPDFPKPVRIGTPRWYPSEVKAYAARYRK